MKRVYISLTILFFILFSVSSYSLTNFNYTGIAFDGTGAILASTNINVNIQLINSGTVAFEENHSNVPTDQFGTYTVEVGSGTNVTGPLSGVTATKNLRIKATTDNGGSAGVWVVSSILKTTVELTSGSSSTGWNLKGNSGTTAGTDFIGTSDGTPTEIRVENSGTINNSLKLNANGSIQMDNPSVANFVNGNSRGLDAVDLQSHRENATNVANGNYSTISGGANNTSGGYIATVGGGAHNISSGRSSTISGGENNTASGSYSTVAGGRDNTAPSHGETVIGLFATTYTPNSSTTFDAADRLFNIGNGTADASRSDAFTILKSGDATLNGDITLSGDILPSTSGTRRIGKNSPATNRWDWLHVEHARVYTDLSVNGTINSNLIPNNNSHNLGSSTRRWATVFVGTAIRIGTSGGGSNDGSLGYNVGNSEFTFSQGINVAGNVTLGDDATADVTTMKSAFVTKYNTVSTGSGYAIPTGTMVMDINATAAITVTLPSGTNGQILYINLRGGNAVTIAGTAYNDSKLTYIYVNGAWTLFNNI